MEAVFDNFAEPPGVYIREELEARGWTQRDLAFILGYSEQTVTKVISGKSGVSAEMAKALGEAFGTSASMWAGLQKEWELREAREPDPAIRARAKMQTKYPIREMISRGWFEEAEQSVLELQFDRFFELNDNEHLGQVGFAAAAKKTRDDHSPEELAWLYRVRQVARSIDAPEYSEAKLRDGLADLRAWMIDPEDVRHVPEFLLAAGVRFVVVEKIANCKVDGVCTWLSDDKPVIGLTLRHNRLDNFWYVLRHEIEHVLRGDGKNGSEIIDNLEPGDAREIIDAAIKEQEDAADDASLNFGFSRNKLVSFYQRKSPYISERDVIGFAGVNEVHPSVVVGQIQHMKKDFSWLRKFLVTVRQHILATSVVDGFGSVADVEL
ncbi:HigA family addiction module antitoxin [Sphingobium phenoxybenzoativorans]|uniref:HigA family addiction module antitoxin n=1 Tax=Sphingobium phenoxybenzoativorans TaxID=1592790 RepID=UPI000A950EF0|nr:HigA family addiction module antitoxin [Sphingobium phenoxybenzoativorans]